MPSHPKRENQEYKKTAETQKEENVATIRKIKKPWIKIFNSPSKSDLKNEIDSLKILIKDLGVKSSEKKSEYQKIKDSLLAIAMEKVRHREKRPDTNYSLTKYDLVEAPEEESGSRIVMPVRNKIIITSSYGSRVHPIFGTKKMHNGIDLKASYENVYTVMDGIVTAAGWDPKGGGNYMKVKHFNRFETSYLHLSEMYYKPGEKVIAGYVIGKSGNSGNSTGPHLHFSVKEYGQNINPAGFLNDLIKINNLIALYNEK
ncbi:M23 family metallopeptidase (plasmid) [Chryseobacterium sp. JJR-5R]|uniref:M23 family metallopeptidase n=1 Tax=Chryseobacterium sp. JJR-5R TaxID=3093923 RepID=UPI002A753473|nr:M23 family metallopeptidase [Chryseobacterium sp. JJR-5R]WPO84656.1 M23 family metallopeptidase [Chryseobacterium sp. JJR-5R]